MRFMTRSLSSRLGKKHTVVIALVVTVLLCTLLSHASSLTSFVLSSFGTIAYAPAGPTRPLHVEGRYIKNDLGDVVFLRGVNWGGYNMNPYGGWPGEGDTAPYSYEAWDDSRPQAHYGVLRDTWGANTIRWTLCIQFWLENRDNYRYYVRRGIELAQEYGIYVILAPWRVPDGTYWENDPMPFPPYTSYSNVIADQQAFIDFWVDVANYLKDLPNWVIDPWNEPFPLSGYHDRDRAVWFDTVAKLILAVRDVTDHIVLVQWMEGIWQGGVYNPSHWVDPFISYLEQNGANSNIVISTHTYAQNNWASDYDTLYNQFRQTGVYHAALEINYPLIFGEIGADETSGVQLTIFNNSLTILNSWGVSYVGWTWARYGDRSYTLLSSGPWIPPPSPSGQVLVDAIKRGS